MLPAPSALVLQGRDGSYSLAYRNLHVTQVPARSFSEQNETMPTGLVLPVRRIESPSGVPDLPDWKGRR